MSWDEIVGQDHAVALLQRSLTRPGHAYLLVGPPGSGVDAAAREFAARLVVDDADVDDRTIDLVRRSLHVDVCEFEPEGTFFLAPQADDVIHEAVRPPVEGALKVIVIHEADRMNETSGNRLLKTIEEPADRLVFVLTTSRPDEVLITLRSRCQRVDFATLSDDAVATVLGRSGGDAEAVRLAAALAGGHIERGRSLLGLVGPVRRAFAEVPMRVDGTGAVAWSVVADLEHALDVAVASTEARHEQATTAHDAELERRGYEGRVAQARKKRLAAKHKRELTRLRRDLLLEGITAIETVYRDVLAAPSAPHNLDLTLPDVNPARCGAALQACAAAREAVLVNEKGNLHLLNLLLQIPGARRH